MLLRVAWRHKGWLLVGLIFGIGAGAAASGVMPSVYQSTAQISILKKYPDAVADIHQISATDSIAPTTEVLRSPAIIEGAIRSRDLAALDIFANGDGEIVAKIRTALTVVPSKVPAGQGNLFRLTYRAGEGGDCQMVLGAVLDSYRAFLKKQHQAAAGDAIELILREQEKVRKELAQQEADYLAFRKEAPLLGKARDGLELKQDRLNSIQAKRSMLLLQQVEVEGQLTAVDRALKEGRGPEAILVMLAEFARKNDAAEPNVRGSAGLQDQLMPLLLEEHRLLRLHGPRHPEIQAIRERIEAARRLLLLPSAAWKGEPSTTSGKTATPDDPVRAHVEVLRQRLEQIKISEGLLAETFQKEQDEARRLASYEIRNETFQNNISLSRQLYEALVKRLNDSSLVKSAGGYHVEVVEPPSAARRVSPNLLLNLAVGMFLGLIGGMLTAVWADGRAGSRNDRIHAGPGPTRGLGPISPSVTEDATPNLVRVVAAPNGSPPSEVLT